MHFEYSAEKLAIDSGRLGAGLSKKFLGSPILNICDIVYIVVGLESQMDRVYTLGLGPRRYNLAWAVKNSLQAGDLFVQYHNICLRTVSVLVV